eukprot:scaffold283_cov316-Pavlova_lutheri.AAC.23
MAFPTHPFKGKGRDGEGTSRKGKDPDVPTRVLDRVYREIEGTEGKEELHGGTRRTASVLGRAGKGFGRVDGCEREGRGGRRNQCRRKGSIGTSVPERNGTMATLPTEGSHRHTLQPTWRRFLGGAYDGVP